MGKKPLTNFFLNGHKSLSGGNTDLRWNPYGSSVDCRCHPFRGHCLPACAHCQTKTYHFEFSMLKTDAFVKLVKLMKRYGGVLSSSVCHLSMAPLFFFHVSSVRFCSFHLCPVGILQGGEGCITVNTAFSNRRSGSSWAERLVTTSTSLHGTCFSHW